MPELKFFQEIGRDYLARRPRALLADQMRLGKTPQAITACDKVGARRILVVCPAIARPVWAAHFREWASAHRLMTSSPRNDMLVAANDLVAIVSYDHAREYPDLLLKRRWDVLICDESHFLKSAEAKRTRLVFAKGGLAWQADRIWCLSGTPAPNQAGELWPMLRAFGMTKMGYGDFIAYFCRLNFDGKPVGTRRERIPELRAILDKFMIRRLKSQVASELPECTLEPWPVDSDSRLLCSSEDLGLVEQARAQERKLRAALAALPAEGHADYLAENVDSYTTMRRINALLKTPAVLETIKFELGNDLVDKLVVFAYHREPIELLQRMLPRALKPKSIHGGTSATHKDQALRAFDTPTKQGGCRVLICQILAAGTAIDLSVAHEGIAVEEDWVPGNNAQAYERMGGYKQTQPITIRKAVLPGSVDEYVSRVLTRKEQELSELFN